MVTLRLFASIRQAAGTRSAEFKGTSVGEIIDAAVDEYGADFAALVPACRIWVNGSPADRTDPVTGGDEVALLPPVSGG